MPRGNSDDPIFVSKENSGGVGQREPSCNLRVEDREKGMDAGSRVKEDMGVHGAVPGIPLGLPQRLQSHSHPRA